MYDLKSMQNAQLEIFKQFYTVCQKNDIPVFLAYGTAIGAERHKGFIPWDDDIDVYIFQEDRERLKEACKRELPDNLFYQAVDTDVEYRLAIDRIRNTETTLVEAEEKDRNINHGIYIDIYPLFRCADSKFKYMCQRVSRLLYRLFLYNEKPKNKSGIVAMCSYALLNICPQFLKNKILKSSTEFVERIGSDEKLSVFYGDDEALVYDRHWFDKAVVVPFEDIEAPVPAGDSELLKAQYGDYMQLPPEEKRKVHHNYICVDCNKSYREYVNK